MKKVLIALVVIAVIFLVWLGIVSIGLGNDAAYVNTDSSRAPSVNLSS